MRFITLLAIFLFAPGEASNKHFDDHFLVVFIDDVTESKFGPVPIDRRILAQAINALADAGAKGVVLKFFLDLQKDAEGDSGLANSIKNFPVILQARIDDREQSPNELPEKFYLEMTIDTAIQGNSGWIPNSHFSSIAYDIGFIDFNGFPISLIETYQGQNVKSLFLCSIEFALDKKATIDPRKQIEVGHLTIKLGHENQTSINMVSISEINYVPFHKVLQSEDWKSRAKDKVVILGYDGPLIHKIETAHGAVPAHRLFVHVLQALFQNGT